MPLESRLFVKTSLVYLVVTFAVGAGLAVARACGIGLPGVVNVIHAHLGFVGWLANIVVGIALWMLPLNRARFPQTQGRYPPSAPYVCYALLNGGLLLRAITEPWLDVRGGTVAAVLFAISGIAQLAGIVIFVAIAWLRVRAPSQPAPGVR
jgi:hypothetical protein